MSDSTRGRPRKLPRLIDDYDLEDIGTELEARWTGTNAPAESLRDLAHWLNRELLEHAMEDAGMDSLAEEVASIYSTLTDDDVSSGKRTQVRRRLERAGVNVEQIERNFVSRQAVYTYLTKNRGVEKPEDEIASKDREVDAVRKLISRTGAVAEDKLTRLRNRGDITLGTFRSSVDVTVHCLECESHYTFDALIQNGGCDCRK